jgi:hypothetical protein
MKRSPSWEAKSHLVTQETPCSQRPDAGPYPEPNAEGEWEYIEQSSADNRQGVVIQLEVGREAKNTPP